jgi:DNA polymerase-3 subunit epsilon
MCDVDLSSGAILREIDQLFWVPIQLEPKIIKITGISNEMLAGCPKFEDKSNEVLAFIESADLVIAHNLSFDKDMVEIEFERLGRVVHWPRGLCTVEQTVGMKGYRLSLSALHQELFGVPFAGSHRAKADVAALVRCCVELRKRDMI